MLRFLIALPCDLALGFFTSDVTHVLTNYVIARSLVSFFILF